MVDSYLKQFSWWKQQTPRQNINIQAYMQKSYKTFKYFINVCMYIYKKNSLQELNTCLCVKLYWIIIFKFIVLCHLLYANYILIKLLKNTLWGHDDISNMPFKKVLKRRYSVISGPISKKIQESREAANKSSQFFFEAICILYKY